MLAIQIFAIVAVAGEILNYQFMFMYCLFSPFKVAGSRLPDLQDAFVSHFYFLQVAKFIMKI